jgi:Ca2+-binding RTX toxin-like protein
VSDAGGTDTITSTVTRSLATYATVENLTLLGSSAINGTGNGLNNTITGNSAANILDGGTGTDTLIGGLGKDTLTGGAANDTFVFKTLQDSSVAAPDLIGDFAVGDKINLSAIDADTGLAGDQAFHNGGGGGHAGDIVATYSSATNTTTVNLYVNNDATIDSVILMTGDHHNLALGDLVL